VWEDARLVTTLMLVLLIAGYLALRRTSTDPEVASKRSAIVGLLLVPNVIVVNRSVEWWDTLHQKSTLVRPDPQIEGLQLFTLFLGIIVGLVVFAWLLIHRFRLAWLEREVADVGLDEALVALRAEAAATAPVDGPRLDAGGAR
jgi:heme exporter protein C